MNKKLRIILIVFAILILFLFLSFSGLFDILNKTLNKFIAETPDKNCSFDSDCALKKTSCAACDCGAAVNKDWNRFCPLPNLAVVMVHCQECPSSTYDFDIKCVNNQCQKVWKNIAEYNPSNVTSKVVTSQFCPKEVFELWPTIQKDVINCSFEDVDYKDEKARIITVDLGITCGEDICYQDIRRFLQTNEGFYKPKNNGLFLSNFPIEREYKNGLLINKTLMLNQTFKTNVNLENTFDKVLVKDDEIYCVVFRFKFPFKGDYKACTDKQLNNITFDEKVIPFNEAKRISKEALLNHLDKETRILEYSDDFDVFIERNRKYYWALFYRTKEKGASMENRYIVRVYMDGRTEIVDYGNKPPQKPYEDV